MEIRALVWRRGGGGGEQDLGLVDKFNSTSSRWKVSSLELFKIDGFKEQPASSCNLGF